MIDDIYEEAQTVVVEYTDDETGFERYRFPILGESHGRTQISGPDNFPSVLRQELSESGYSFRSNGATPHA